MNGKTNKMRRRLSVVALAASVAAIAIPAASAGGKYFGPGSNTVEKLGPYGVYWVPMARVLGPGSNTVEKRGPYGAYWVPKLSRQSGSEQLPRADDGMFREIIQDAAEEHGASGFGNTTQAVRVLKEASSGLAPNYSHLPTEDRP
jgi:hypothetical protein